MDGLNQAIEHFGGHHRGGLKRLAEALGVSPSRVSMWRQRGKVPITDQPWPLRIQEATNEQVPAWRIRPDVYPPPAQAA